MRPRCIAATKFKFVIGKEESENGNETRVLDEMSCRYLLHFVHEHLSFRWPEFLALASKNNCNFKLISAEGHLKTRPYIIIELENFTDETSLIKSARASYLLKDLYELWAYSATSVDDLAEQATQSDPFSSRRHAGPDQPFRVNCESFAAKLSQSTKVEWIRKMTFLETFDSGVNLREPKQIYCIFEMNEKLNSQDTNPKKEYYFGRHITQGSRAALGNFSLKTRKFIANTTMDPLLSLVAANCAKVEPDQLVFDPFVGSGGLLVAAAHMGAFVMGSDIDWLLLHGKSRPSRIGQKKREPGESVRANFSQYDLLDRYLDVMVSDITRCPLRRELELDAIISDPPYGIRECSEKIGKRSERQPKREHKVRYPSKISYRMSELLEDLLTLAADHLKIGGRLIYFLPVIASEDPFEVSIPRHPSLNLVSCSEQSLIGKNFRLMVVMEKSREPENEDRVHVPDSIDGVKFREMYFNKKES